MEYCNSPAGTTSLAELREKGGDRDPLNVKFWGVGNESWGCGGSFTGDEYAVEFRRFIEWVPKFDVDPAFIASVVKQYLVHPVVVQLQAMPSKESSS